MQTFSLFPKVALGAVAVTFIARVKRSMKLFPTELFERFIRINVANFISECFTLRQFYWLAVSSDGNKAVTRPGRYFGYVC